jgi:hypothetical protein
MSRLLCNWIVGVERESEDGETLDESRNIYPGAIPLVAIFHSIGSDEDPSIWASAAWGVLGRGGFGFRSNRAVQIRCLRRQTCSS